MLKSDGIVPGHGKAVQRILDMTQFIHIRKKEPAFLGVRDELIKANAIATDVLADVLQLIYILQCVIQGYRLNFKQVKFEVEKYDATPHSGSGSLKYLKDL